MRMAVCLSVCWPCGEPATRAGWTPPSPQDSGGGIQQPRRRIEHWLFIEGVFLVVVFRNEKLGRRGKARLTK